ncbi:hypothetical protein AAEO56_04585 [Flavobacterium sp. DGU11]|uniref:Uncharacterized protein n=1 Tax=Flavobacterium arundinis TaxID=3139143 RepID=A0ABU9HTN4_9FLAO
MKIVAIFDIIEESLYSVQYDSENKNEFRRLFDLWNDPIYLHDFFTNHIGDLHSGVWGSISIEEAIERTRREAKMMEAKILELAETGKTSKYDNLSEYFRPLTLKETGRKLERDKGKGLNKHNWLRVYAIRIDSNTFVICGGAIKLTADMNERAHLLLELEKFNIAQEYLKDEENPDLEFIEL